MTFRINIASDWNAEESVVINALEDLENLQAKYNHKLIVDFVHKTITVYDDYIE